MSSVILYKITDFKVFYVKFKRNRHINVLKITVGIK